MAEKSILTGIKRGLALRCPSCGEGRLFASYLKIKSPCAVCGADNSIYPSDDFPPYLTILIAGHIVVPLFVISDRAFDLPVWLHLAFWIPLTAVLCLFLLPYMKGATVGLCWATNILRREPSR
jgi:uncharacterized protein (DUF983 family)